MKIKQHYCEFCDALRPFEKGSVSHVLHLLLTLFTFGCWFPVWLILTILEQTKPGRCRACGSEHSSIWTRQMGPFKDAPPARTPRTCDRLLAERKSHLARGG